MKFLAGEYPITVNIPDTATLGAAVSERWRQGEGFALATLNLDHLVKLRRDPAFRMAYHAMDFVTADGNPIVWLSRLAGQPVSLLPGSDILMPLLHMAGAKAHGVAFLGSSTEALTRAEEALTRQVPGLQVVARIAPPMGFDPTGDEAEQMLRDVQASGARLCILALGAPKQEILAVRGRTFAPEVGFCCFGAGLDFFAGAQRRAPWVFRALALEWLWRALSSPARMVPRYARCFAILPAEIRAALAQRSGRPQ